jgi:hypothetical protein
MLGNEHQVNQAPNLRRRQPLGKQVRANFLQITDRISAVERVS